MAKKSSKDLPQGDDQSVIREERDAEIESDVALEATSTELDGQLTDPAEIDGATVEAETDTDPVVPAEVAAIHTDTVAAKEASGDGVTKKKVSEATPVVRKARSKQRSARYQKVAALVDLEKEYSLEQAIKHAKETSYTKFDASIELHVHLLEKKAGSSESLRTLLQLPHGTGKTMSAAVLTDELIDKIAAAKQTEFDVLIAPRALMPKVAKIAKILGPQGKMPSPKSGTVTDDPEAALAAIQGGRIELRSDAQFNVHQGIGKVSWDEQKLADNAMAVISTLPRHQLHTVTLSATMGPGIRVAVSTLRI